MLRNTLTSVVAFLLIGAAFTALIYFVGELALSPSEGLELYGDGSTRTEMHWKSHPHNTLWMAGVLGYLFAAGIVGLVTHMTYFGPEVTVLVIGDTKTAFEPGDPTINTIIDGLSSRTDWCITRMPLRAVVRSPNITLDQNCYPDLVERMS